MGEVKHTPGPWTVRKSKVPHDGAYDYAVSAAGVSVLSEAFGRDADGGYPPAEANATLIAAAPELLGMCERYADFIRSSVRAADLEMHPYLPELEALIAKAKGE